MSRHLIIGASGLVGSHLLRAAQQAGHQAVGTYCSCRAGALIRLEVGDRAAVRGVVEADPPAVIHLPAARAHVDQCERDPAASFDTNVRGVVHVVEAANEAGATLVYFSSDYVFDGRQGPYRETDPAHPICEYGRQKLQAEHYVALHCRDFLIIRTTVVYGWEVQGKNFLYRLRDHLAAGLPLAVPSDQIGTPTQAANLAAAVVSLVDSGARGLYHVAGPDRVGREVFAREAAVVLGLDPELIQAAPTAALGQLAPRPLSAGLVSARATALLGIPLLGYREGLRRMVEERGAVHAA